MAKNIEARLDRLEKWVGSEEECTVYWLAVSGQPVQGWKSGEREWRRAEGESDDDLRGRVLNDAKGGGVHIYIGFREHPSA